MRSICFVNADNLPVLDPNFGSNYIGGESVQQTLLAREFARRGWRVTMVCEDFGQPDGVEIDGIRVYKTFRPDEGIPVARFIYPRLLRIRRALARADSDVYYQSCAGVMTGFVARFCRSRARTMIFRVAHDTDCIPGRQLIRFSRDRKIYEYGIKRAAIIAAQSEQQQRLLADHYGIDAAILNMSVQIPDSDADKERNIDVLWVNNLRDFKRPDLLISLAQEMPDKSFVMIGGPVAGYESLHDSIIDAVKQLPNVDYRGAVPYHDVNRYFDRARLFVNTSDSEGFPNSFLQAWVRRVPVISFFDPDSVISGHGLGTSPDSLEGMRSDIETFLASHDRRVKVGEAARSFVIRRFAPGTVVDDYLALLRNLSGNARSRCAADG